MINLYNMHPIVLVPDNTKITIAEKPRAVKISDPLYEYFIALHGFIPYDEYKALILPASSKVLSISREQIERNKKETTRAELLEELRPAMDLAVNTMSIGSNIRTTHMSNEALLGLGSLLSNLWNTALMAADPVGSAVGLATGHLAGKGAVALNHAVGSPITDESAHIAGAVLGGYAGARYMAPVVKATPSVVQEVREAYRPLPEGVVSAPETGLRSKITNFLFRPVDRAVQTGEWSSLMTKLNEKFVQFALKYPNLSKRLVESVTSRPKVSREALASYAETVGVPESRAAINQAIQEGRYYPYMTRQLLRNYFTEGQKVVEGAVSDELIRANAGAATMALQYQSIRDKAKLLSDDMFASVPEADAYANALINIQAGTSVDDAIRANGLTTELFIALKNKYGDVIFPNNTESSLYYFSEIEGTSPHTEYPTTTFTSKRRPGKELGEYDSFNNKITVSARYGLEDVNDKILRPLYARGYTVNDIPTIHPVEFTSAHEGQHFLLTLLPLWQSSVIRHADYFRTNPVSKYASDFPYWTGLKTEWQFAPIELDANLKALNTLYPNASIYDKAAALTLMHPDLFNGDVGAMVKLIERMQTLGYKRGGKLNYLNLFRK